MGNVVKRQLHSASVRPTRVCVIARVTQSTGLSASATSASVPMLWPPSNYRCDIQTGDLVQLLVGWWFIMGNESEPKI